MLVSICQTFVVLLIHQIAVNDETDLIIATIYMLYIKTDKIQQKNAVHLFNLRLEWIGDLSKKGNRVCSHYVSAMYTFRFFFVERMCERHTISLFTAISSLLNTTCLLPPIGLFAPLFFAFALSFSSKQSLSAVLSRS